MSERRKKGTRLAKASLAKSNRTVVVVEGIYEDDRQKFIAMAADLGITFDGNNNVDQNQTNDNIDINVTNITTLANAMTLLNAKMSSMSTLFGITFDGSGNITSESYTTHNHDDRYYTESEIDTLLNDKSDTDHTHPPVAVAPASYGSFYLTTGGLTELGSTVATLIINNEGENTGEMSLLANEVTISKTSTFEIDANVYINNSSTARVEYSMWIEINGTEVPGSRFASYQRGYDSGMTSGVSIIAQITSGDTIRLRCQLTDGTTTSGYQDDNGTRLNIKEM